jgi:hypothetical protein
MAWKCTVKVFTIFDSMKVIPYDLIFVYHQDKVQEAYFSLEFYLFANLYFTINLWHFSCCFTVPGFLKYPMPSHFYLFDNAVRRVCYFKGY